MKPSERYELVAKLKVFVAEVTPVMTRLSDMIGVPGSSLSNYQNDASLPSGRNFTLLKAFLEKPIEAQKEAYQQHLLNSGTQGLQRRVATLEAELLALKLLVNNALDVAA
jgi:hypothetical protein